MKTTFLLMSACALAITDVGTVARRAAAEPGSARPTKLVISEMTYNVRSTWEWLELYNGTNHTIDLSTYVVDNDQGERPFTRPNLTGKLEPGKFAIVYDFAYLKESNLTESKCKDGLEDICAEMWQQNWPTVNRPLMIPWRSLPWRGPWATQRVSLWASMDDYKADLAPVDRRIRPSHAVFSMSPSEQHHQAFEKLRTDAARAGGVGPGAVYNSGTLYLANLAGDPGDSANWKFTVDKAEGVVRAKAQGWDSETANHEVGSPGRF